MKKTVIVMLLAIPGVLAQANLLLNPGFEEGDTGQVGVVPIPGWNSWGTAGWHNTDAGAVIDTKSIKFWWDGIGMWQDFAATPGRTYVYSVQVIDSSRDTSPKNWDLQMEAEFYDASKVQLAAVVLDYFDSTIQPDDTWVEIGGSLTAPAGTSYGRVILRVVDWQSGIAGALYCDNVSVYDQDLYGQAYAPNPANGSTVLLSLANLSWQNRPARNLADTVSCDVYLEAEGPIIDPNFQSAPIAVGVTSSTVDLALAGVTLQDNKLYTWRVDSTDPNMGGNPIVTPGEVWTFQIGDVAPVVNAPDHYIWLQNDIGQVTLTGSYTDDDKSSIVRAEFVEGNHERDPNSIVTFGTHIHDSVAKTVSVPVTISNTAGRQANGWYGFTLEVEDGAGVGSANLHVGVYGTCLEAALEDPTDTTIETNWPNGLHGDINGDCKTDLEDFALLASSWIDCMTVKAGCTP
ncbi:MAG: hypothetical protein LLF76_05575 [Planctomycetaceae bacterium]|nr:hypothetical protein [Planctomycetaceae bacterium]